MNPCSDTGAASFRRSAWGMRLSRINVPPLISIEEEFWSLPASEICVVSQFERMVGPVYVLADVNSTPPGRTANPCPTIDPSRRRRRPDDGPTISRSVDVVVRKTSMIGEGLLE